MTEQEKTLIAGCLRGDKAAWDSFVQQYSSLVYHTVRKTLTLHHTDQREDVVDDLYQELFVSLLRDDCKKLRQFRGDRGCTIASWLRVVASRLTIDHLRQQRPKDVEATDAIPSNQMDVPSALIEREEERALGQAMEALSPRDRLIIELSFHQSLSPEEIAGVLKISVGAFYTQKSRVLAKLREVLQDEASV
jgi:RNA polymerase sigma factor (sigma-70 family)